MTIDEAIQHCRDTALSNAGNAIAYLKGGQKMLAESCEKCAAEHEQLAKWLEELKQRREAEPVRHGRWINDTFCSECKRFPVDVSVSISNQELTKYFSRCPHCGAKMDAQDGGAENAKM